MEKRKFNHRAFAALILTLTGLGLPVTGVLNHTLGFEPPTLVRHAWMSAHNVLGLAFVVFSLVHVVLNRRALLAYATRSAHRLPAFSREGLAALALIAALLVLSVGHAFAADGAEASVGRYHAGGGARD